MEFKGTKGKWNTNTYCVFIGNEELIGENVICRFHNGLKKYMGDDQKANALLISKAPEMLDMLKEATKVIEWYMENAKPDNNHTDFFNIGMNQRTQIEQLINSATTI